MNINLQIKGVLLLGLMLMSSLLFSQDILRVQLDKYYTGGNHVFIEYMKDNVPYPESAKLDGLIGLSVVSFKIDCENIPFGFIFQTELGYGIEKGIQKAIENTEGNWVNCDNSEQLIRLNIAFDINKHYGHEKEDFTIYVEGPYEVMTDESLVKYFNNRLNKEKYKQAKQYLEWLIIRYPFSEDYKTTLHKINAKIR